MVQVPPAARAAFTPWAETPRAERLNGEQTSFEAGSYTADRSNRVWLNLPPARVWLLEKLSDAERL